MRLFIGIPLSAGARRLLGGVQEELKSLAHGRYVPAENLHITLRFIGESKALGDISRALDEACLGFAPFDIVIGGLGKFDRQGRALVFANVEDPNRKLRALHESMENALCDAGLGRDGRTFKPHITLGREVELSAPIDMRFPEITMRTAEAALFESLRTQYGMKYTPLHRIRF